MDDYEKAFYDYQTLARGLLDKNALQIRFDKLASFYGRRLKKFLPKSKDALCLDVPCGYGNFLYFLDINGYVNIVGIDSDKKQIDLAKLMQLPAELGDAFEVLSDKEQSYDLITSLDFIEHLSKDAALIFLDLCFKRLNAGGKLILRAPCSDGPFGSHDTWNDITHKWAMTSNLLRTLLEMEGFTNINILDERPQPTGFVELIRWLIFLPSKFMADIICICLGMRPPKIWSRSMIAVACKPQNV